MEQTLRQQLIQKVTHYHTPDTAVQLLSDNLPLILVGVTAAGKNTIGTYIEQAGIYKRVVTHTTRPIRHDEQDGRDYYFVDEAGMINLIDQQAFIETKMIHGDTAYGSSLQSYRDAFANGHKPLRDIDVQGVHEVSKRVPSLRAFFVLPPSFEIWLERLSGRGQMSHVERLRRFQSAIEEIQIALNSQTFILITNHEVHATANKILSGTRDPQAEHESRQVAEQLIHDIRSFH